MKGYRRNLSLVILLSLATIVSVVFWLDQSRAQNRLDLLRAYIGTLDEIILQARMNFYKEVDEEEMLRGALRGAVAALHDPYSFYQSPQEQQREQENLFQAQFGGLGIRIFPDYDGETGVVRISQVLREGPARRHGLQPGDAIIKVDGKSVILGGPEGLSLNDVVSMLRGPVGEPVTVTILRRNRPEPFDVTMKREIIHIDSVRWTLVEPGIGYVMIDSFTSQTGREFANAVAELTSQGPLKTLILDLRGNRGGMLETAKEVTDAFLSGGVIVSTRGRNPEFNHVYTADSDVIVPPEVEVVVLVDQDSASGSEIVAGALKDHNRALILGTKTYGKGVVQQRFRLRNGGAVSLTISTYYTPNETSIDGEGIEPHVVVEPDRLTEEEAFFREKVRERGLIEDYVQEYITAYERERGEPPKDFSELAARVPEMVALIEKENLHLSPKAVLLEARNVFDYNLGIDRLIDLEYDRQLIEAMRIIKEYGVARALREGYAPPVESLN